MQKISAVSLSPWLRSLFFLGSLLVAHGVYATEPITTQPHGIGLAQFTAQSIQSHSSVPAAHAQLGAAGADVDAERAQYYPKPSVQVRQDQDQSSTVLALQQPLWAGGRIDAVLDYAASVGRRIAGGTSGQVGRALVNARVAQPQGDLNAARSAQRNVLARLAQLTGTPLRPQELAAAVVSGSWRGPGAARIIAT
jgi:adhesin transport system outer membrane protein